MIKANILSFGNEVGAVTNRVTSMFEVRAGFDKDSKEYEMLDYRIQCGQLYQQNSIDKAKGIVANPMPQSWYIWHNCNTQFDKDIVADKKPYFMKYIYPEHKRKYDKYVKNCENKCKMKYGMGIDELRALPNKDEFQNRFLEIYDTNLPLGINPCTINRICWKIENIFSKYYKKNSKPFDYKIYKSNHEYTKYMYSQINKLYGEYQNEVKTFMNKLHTERVKTEDKNQEKLMLIEKYKQKIKETISDDYVACDILLDVCYGNDKSKDFVWNIFVNIILQNLYKNSEGTIKYPVKNDDGDIFFHGERFSIIDRCLTDEELEWLF